MDRVKHRLFVLVLLFTVFFLLYRSSDQVQLAARPPDVLPGPELFLRGLRPANATLGFGAVAAVSRTRSPRREALLAAANATGINITVPDQPAWTDGHVLQLRAERNSSISYGSALAWLGHLNALRWFLSTGLETALILEDDVDWDLRLRTTQIPAVAAIARKLVGNAGDRPGHVKYRASLNNYWGNSSDWDVLYLGHCGDVFGPASLGGTPRIMYQDDTLLPRSALHIDTRKFLDALGLSEGMRLVHKSIFPLCSFGYAITRNAASRLVNAIAARESDGGTMAFDVRMLEACRPEIGFRCWSINPELFHHVHAQSEIALIDTRFRHDEVGRLQITSGDGERSNATVEGRAPNIACSARHEEWRDEACVNAGP